MREIKFRVWSKSYRGFTKQRMDFMHLSESKVIPIDNDGDLIWCQYTGLKDKNGVEIYEGDIVKVCGDRVFEIVYSNGCFNCKSNNKEFALLIAVQNSNVHECDLNVIGNIYEHPHLLHVKDEHGVR